MLLKFFKLFIILILAGTSASFAFDKEKEVKVRRGKLIYEKREQKIKIFVEGIRLDMDYATRNMKFVDFVNDPAVSDVHIIINDRTSGSGGRVYSLMFNNNTFDNLNNFTLTTTTASSDTYEEQRKKIVDSIVLGLMPFVNQTEASNKLVIRYRGQESTRDLPIDDPWNNWTFRGDFSGNVDLEESKNNFNYRYNLRIDKVTDDWKFRNSGMTSIRTREYSNNGEKFSVENITNYVTSSVVNSLSPRWSAGAFASYYNSNYRNTVYSISFKPAVEYNIFPWDVSDRKVFTLAYYIGPEWKKYYQTSIFGKTEESLWEHTFRLDLQLIKTWGEVEAGIDATNYLHDFSLNRITFDTEVSVRVVRGFSVNFDFRAENINDQIYLPSKEASLEDILLNRVQLPSSFEIYAGVGVRVQFGSIYNNIVNNRL